MEAEEMVFEGDFIGAELASLNLTEAILRRVVGECALAKASTTAHHPKTAGGSMGWFEAVRSARDQLVPRGWESKDHLNQGLVIEPKLGIVVAIAGGDRDTGMRDGSPATRSRKGATTKFAVEANARQLKLFNDTEVVANLVTIKDFGVLWLLLVFVDSSKRQARAELSRPVKYAGGRPSLFDRRIILDPIDLDGEDMADLVTPPSGSGSPEFKVEIVRRA